jgi:hypothetical protein
MPPLKQRLSVSELFGEQQLVGAFPWQFAHLEHLLLVAGHITQSK